jgi:hypothetical protein
MNLSTDEIIEQILAAMRRNQDCITPLSYIRITPEIANVQFKTPSESILKTRGVSLSFLAFYGEKQKYHLIKFHEKTGNAPPSIIKLHSAFISHYDDVDRHYQPWPLKIELVSEVHTIKFPANNIERALIDDVIEYTTEEYIGEMFVAEFLVRITRMFPKLSQSNKVLLKQIYDKRYSKYRDLKTFTTYFNDVLTSNYSIKHLQYQPLLQYPEINIYPKRNEMLQSNLNKEGCATLYNYLNSLFVEIENFIKNV